VFNVTNSIIGGGILALPSAFMAAGVVLGGSLIIFEAFVAIYAAWLLMAASNYAFGYATSFKSLGRLAFGKAGPILVELVVFSYLFGAMTGYLVIIRDSLFGVVSENFDWDIPKQVVLLVPTVLIVLPLTTLRSIAPLRITGLISFVLILFLSGCIIFRGVQHISEHPLTRDEVPLANLSWSLFSGLPLIAFAYTFHGSLFASWGAMKDPSPRSMTISVFCGVLLCMVMYIIVGLFGFLNFLQDTDKNILLNYGEHDILLRIAQGLYSFVICFAYPMLAFPARLIVDSALFSGEASFLRRLIEAVILVGGSYALAILPIDIGIVFGLVGATFGQFLGAIFPGLFFILIVDNPRVDLARVDSINHDNRGKSRSYLCSWKKVPAYLLVLLGAFSMAIGVWQQFPAKKN
jgi:sodium-coupled neutral amino acid transporter 11